MSVEQSAQLTIPADNRPAPLAAAPLPLLADTLCQMSFGERLVLEGLLSQLKPRLAIEVGTYEGGSLSFLSAHCGHVHTFDLYDLVAERGAFANVTFHTGDSKLLLPPALRTLEADRQGVDFALIDGDHSAEGVRQDLANLLESSATAATVILLHDTMNDQTRAGIEAVDPAAHPKVVYCELDLIPGYEFVGGHFDGQIWGGLGLMITGDRELHGYGASPLQTLYREPYEILHGERRLRAERDSALRELARTRATLDGVTASLSWRLTEPLRWAKRRLPARLTRRS